MEKTITPGIPDVIELIFWERYMKNGGLEKT